MYLGALSPPNSIFCRLLASSKNKKLQEHANFNV